MLARSLVLFAAFFAIIQSVNSEASAQEDSVQDLVKGLSLRGVNPVPPKDGDHNSGRVSLDQFKSNLGKLRAPAFGRPEVTTSEEERAEIQTYIEEQALAAIDIEVYFDTGSADIRQQSLPDVTKLGLALRDPQLEGGTFLIVGHTDARGSARSNLLLSQRRAQSVRDYLVKGFSIDERQLIAVGYGEEQLKFPASPNAEQNRRVQVVNVGG